MYYKIMICLLILSTTIFANTKGSKSKRVINKVFEGGIESYMKPSYALLIGNSTYESKNRVWDDLPSIPNEINEIKEALTTQGFKKENIFVHDNLTGKELKSIFEDFIYKYGFSKNNRLFIMYSGHGESDPDGINGYLVGTDAKSINNIGNFYSRSLSMRAINTLAKDMKAKHAMFVFDSCFSGLILALRGSNEDIPEYLSPTVAKNTRQFITSGSATQKVPAKSQFALMLAQILRGEIGDISKDGYITGTEMGAYIKSNLPKYSKTQTPQFGTVDDIGLSQGEFLFVSNRQKSLYVFENKHEDLYKLTIVPTPKDVKVQILNSNKYYYDGIELKKDKYKIEVSKKGYITKEGEIYLNEDTHIDVHLEKDNLTKKRKEKALIAVKPILNKKLTLNLSDNDSDSDGVIDKFDYCPETPFGREVNKVGCAETLELKINFDLNSFTIRDEDINEIKALAKFLMNYADQDVLLEAHTDSQGAARFNMQLSEKRALAIKYFLVQLGVKSSRIEAKGYGETQPIADNSTSEGREENRRITIIFM